MSHSVLRVLAYLALASAPFAVADGAAANVSDMSGGALSSFSRLSPAQTIQFGSSNCYYAEGWNGRGWYQCGDQWNDGFGWIGPFNLNTFGGAAVRRHHPHTFAVSHPPAANPVYPRLEPSRRPGAGGAPAFHTFGNGPGFRRFGAAGVGASPNFHARAATVTPGFAGGGFRGGLGGGNFYQFHGAGVPHIGVPLSPGFAGGGGFHGLGGAGNFHGAGIGVPHIGAPVSPGFTGGGAFHGLGGATGVHIGAPASPGFGGLGTFHAGGGMGAPHIGAFASPGFAGGGFHGVGGAGAFQGGGAGFGQGGIGHR
jgi:hypothetical protein